LGKALLNGMGGGHLSHVSPFTYLLVKLKLGICHDIVMIRQYQTENAENVKTGNFSLNFASDGSTCPPPKKQ